MEETNKQFEKIPFNQDLTKDNRFEEHYDLFRDYVVMKEQPIRFFNKNGVQRNIIDYVNDSVDRMNEYQLKPAHKDDWQSNVFDPKTRDKLIAILSLMAASRMKPQLHLKPYSIFHDDDMEVRKNIYSDLLEAANRKNKDEQQLLWEMYTAMSEGTVIGFESWKRDTREVEYVKEYNPDTGEKKVEKIKYDAWDDVYGDLVPIDEFFPETIWTSNFDDVKRCFWNQEMSIVHFKDRYGKFPNANKVFPRSHFIEGEKLPWGISETVLPENVQVLQFFDEVADKMGIWANGVELYYGALPWNHKKKPFWLGINELIHHKFLFGKSLPDKLMSMQDVNNATVNGMLDQLYLALNSPIFVDGENDLDDGYLEPGRIYETQPGTNVQRVALGQNDPATFQLLSLIQRSMEETSISAQAQGVPTGGRKTKFEVQQLQEGAMSLASLFLTLMERTMAQKYWLRMHNIIQYYSMPSRTKTGKKKFKFIMLEDRKLTNNKVGVKMIEVVNSSNELPQPSEIAERIEKQTGEEFNPLTSRIEPVVITRDYFLNNEFDMEIEVVPNSSVKESQAAKDNKAIAYYQMTAQDPMIDQEKNKINFTKAMGQPEDLVIKKSEQPQQPLVPGEQEQAGVPGGVAGRGIPALPQPDMDML